MDFENKFWEERLSHRLVLSWECQAFEAISAQRLRKGSAAEAQGGPQLQVPEQGEGRPPLPQTLFRTTSPMFQAPLRSSRLRQPAVLRLPRVGENLV